MQHIMGILTRVSLQDGEWKLEAERLQRLLPTAQNQPGALDERSLDVENHQRTTGRHGNQLEQRQPRRFATTRAAWRVATAACAACAHPAPLIPVMPSQPEKFPQLCSETD